MTIEHLAARYIDLLLVGSWLLLMASPLICGYVCKKLNIKKGSK